MFTNAWGSRNDDIFQPHRSIKGELSKHELAHFTAPLRTLEEVKTNYGIKHIRLMKLDCEGCEWTVGLSMMHNGDWKMVDMLFGELHALCQNDVSDAAECLPRNVSTTAGRDLWYFLCEARKFPLEWGCEEPPLCWTRRLGLQGEFLSRALTASPLTLRPVRSRGSLESGSPDLRKLRHQSLAVCLGQEALQRPGPESSSLPHGIVGFSPGRLEV